MSISSCVYIGPYIKIKRKETTHDRNALCCTNMDCQEYHQEVADIFCRKCGGKIIISTVTRSEIRGWKEFGEYTKYEYEDDCYSPDNLGNDDEDIVISNITSYTGIYELTDNELDRGFVSLSTMDYESAIAVGEFIDRNVHMLTKMEEFFNVDSINVNYGVCSYWS